MTSAPIVGVIGKKRAGKDTFGKALIEAHGFTRVAFADPLRQALLALDPLVGISGTIERLRKLEPGLQASTYVRLRKLIDVVGWEIAKDYVPEVRRLLERFGTDSIRSLDDDFWVRMAVEKIQATDGPVVVTDVRFPNEADRIRELGGSIVRVIRPDQVVDAGAHECETALDEYREDVTLYNHLDDSFIRGAKLFGEAFVSKFLSLA